MRVSNKERLGKFLTPMKRKVSRQSLDSKTITKFFEMEICKQINIEIEVYRKNLIWKINLLECGFVELSLSNCKHYTSSVLITSQILAKQKQIHDTTHSTYTTNRLIPKRTNLFNLHLSQNENFLQFFLSRN